MKVIFTFLAIFTVSMLYSQMQPVTVCLGTDATACQGQSVEITNCTPATNISNGITLNGATTVTLSDDNWSGLVNIGFNFSFYGNTYTQCVIGSNGLISFNAGNANGYCPYSFTAGNTLPNAGVTGALNSIMLAYSDLNPADPSTPANPIQYQTIGTAPNRKFITLFSSVSGFSCGATACTYGGIILYETSNVIEVFVGNKGICSGWNGGLAYEGIQDANGTNAVMVPGRNCSQWSVNQDGQRWTPTAPNNTSGYVNSSIPYIFINSTLNNSTVWASTTGQVYPYNNGVLTVNQTVAGPVGYFLSGAACGNAIGSISDTTFVTIEAASVTASMTADICNSGSGTVTANTTAGQGPYTFNWGTLGTGQTINNVFPGTYTVTMTTATGCQATAQTTVTTSTANFTGTTTLVSCPGGNDGTATANMAPVLGTLSYLWDDPAAQTTQTATGLSAGTYTCAITSSVGCNGTVTVTISEIPGITASINAFTDVTCNSGSDGSVQVNTSQGTQPYTYAWSNSTCTTNFPNDLSAGMHSVTITDANGCSLTLNQQINEPAPLSIVTLSPSLFDTICPGNSRLLTVTGAGGSSTYTYTWKENGIIIGSGSSITVTPANTNTQYCVELSEVCGSPIADSCMTINFPQSIQASISPDVFEGCEPARFLFTNNSNLGSQIQSTQYNFSDGTSSTTIGNDTISHFFTTANTYSIFVTITSKYGCEYTANFPGIVLVNPVPVADFFINPNPTTIFETTVEIQDRSSLDVINWDWNSPNSIPMVSNDQNPVFKFPEGIIAKYPITLIVHNEAGCSDTNSYDLNVISDIIFYAPNSFTPNGDEFNNQWKFFVEGIDEQSFELSIFNKWGQIIFETQDINQGWDGTFNGKIVETGTYNWKVIVKDLYTDDKKLIIGSVNVLR